MPGRLPAREAPQTCRRPVHAGPQKKAGRPEAARQSCPGEGTDQKPTVMPVTKPVPSILRPLAMDLSAVKIEVFEATPGASV